MRFLLSNSFILPLSKLFLKEIYLDMTIANWLTDSSIEEIIIIVKCVISLSKVSNVYVILLACLKAKKKKMSRISNY